MRQQVEGLMSTRDELKWKVKHLEAELKEASRVRQLVAEQNNMLKLQLNVLKNDNETLRKDNLNLEAMTQKKNPLLNGH